MNDFEQRLAALLNEQVDHELAGRAARGSDVLRIRTGRGARPGTRWLPLLAAACVVAVAASGYGATQLLSAPKPADRSVIPGPVPSRSGASATPTPSLRIVPAPATGSASRSTTGASVPSNDPPASPDRGASSSGSSASSSKRPPRPSTGSASRPSGPSPTATVVLRPVTAAGVPAAGWRVEPESTPVTCTQGASPVAVDDDIRSCGTSADNAEACWLAADAHHVLCLSDPFARTLRRLTLSGRFAGVAASAHPAPQGITLDDGRKFLHRVGGAAAALRQHPGWVAFYYQRATFRSAVYGPASGDGVDTTNAAWSARVYPSDGQGTGVTHPVSTAYEVGTAS